MPNAPSQIILTRLAPIMARAPRRQQVVQAALAGAQAGQDDISAEKRALDRFRLGHVSDHACRPKRARTEPYYVEGTVADEIANATNQPPRKCAEDI